MNEDLVKRFAPILFLHPEEKFFPVDAKRYLEFANLWSSAPPFSDDTKWGKPGTAPSTRQPVIVTGGLTGVATEPGRLIDDPSLRPAEAEMFLELGGWKNAAGAHETGVTATSSNAYSDRSAIADMYGQEPLLDSRFWYHAEIYDGARLTAMARRAGPPDFSPYLTPNSTLLFYYLFFPAHEQAINTGQDFCQNSVSSQEEACRAGDWQCVAIFLEGDGSGDASKYSPKFFGCTGCRPDPTVPGTSQCRPCQFDAEGLTVMKVERWQPPSGPAAGLPQVDGDHPRLYVALGSHSLYTTPGDHGVQPYRDGEEPQGCGTFDTPSVMPPDWGQPDDDTLEDIGAFLAKVMGGFLAGGPAGEIAGVVAAAAEGYYPQSVSVNVVGTADAPDPDHAPAAGDGITIAPAGVTVAGAGIAMETWKGQQNLQIGNRTYNYLVDRTTQRWWSNDNSETGFRGRWGQHVTADFLPRRSGPKFPNYLQLFLLALARGDVTGAFKE